MCLRLLRRRHKSDRDDDAGDDSQKQFFILPVFARKRLEEYSSRCLHIPLVAAECSSERVDSKPEYTNRNHQVYDLSRHTQIMNVIIPAKPRFITSNTESTRIKIPGFGKSFLTIKQAQINANTLKATNTRYCCCNVISVKKSNIVNPFFQFSILQPSDYIISCLTSIVNLYIPCSHTKQQRPKRFRVWVG